MPSLEQIENLFHQALLIDGDVERRQWLADRCEKNARLFSEVVSLLEAHQAVDSVSEVPGESEVPTIPSELFGPYRAVRFLGRGGMSTVYLAERADGRFDQNVAIKLMAAHLAGDDFRRRFDTEGRILAALRHPNITNLLDGGVSSSGHPYLAMEFVEGEALDAHCDRRKLSIEARLQLFLQVADAVEYAHRNFILHRDLKPGNILVTEEGQAKLLDFGTASLLSGTTNITVTRARMLTPRYASPEQLRGQRPGVAGDVFSLGVVLYELLTGAWPFGDPDSVVRELQRATGDVSPTRPGSAITEPAAERRSISCERLRRMLGGDLSAIMMKALENEPSRRYSTVREFADDLRHYMEGRPVEARAQTALYRVGKFVRRRWIAVAATSVFIIGIAVAAVVAALAARSARAEALKSEQVNRFLTEMVARNDRDRADAGKYTVEQMLEAADQRLQNGQETQQGGPLTLAVLHRSLAAGYLGQQRYDKVQFHLDRALPVFRAAGDNLELATTLRIQARSEEDQGHYQDADRLFQETMAIFRRMGKDAPAVEVFETKRLYAQLLFLMMHTRLEEAGALYDDLVAAGRRDSSIPRVELAVAMANRSGMMLEARKFQEAETGALEALAIGRKEAPGGGWEWDPLYILTQIYYSEYKYQAAKEAAQRMIDISVRNEGADSLTAAQSKNIWAGYAAQTGEGAAAVAALRESMPVIEKLVQSPSMNLWHAARNASNVMRREGQLAEAEHYARESLAVAQAAHLAENDARPGNSWEALGRALREEKKYAEAIQAFEQAEASYRSGGKTWSGIADQMHKLIGITRADLSAKR